jgi:hypothetical protein
MSRLIHLFALNVKHLKHRLADHLFTRIALVGVPSLRIAVDISEFSAATRC